MGSAHGPETGKHPESCIGDPGGRTGTDGKSECRLQCGESQLGADRKYHGSLDGLREQNIVVEELIAGYAILTVPENRYWYRIGDSGDEYVEKPKRFYYQQTDPDGASCFPPVTRRTPFLNGRGVLLYWIPGSPGIWRCSLQGRWQYEDTVSMGSDDSGKAGRITGAGDAAESDIATESRNL